MRSKFIFLLMFLLGPSAMAQQPFPTASPNAVGLSSERLGRISAVLQAEIAAGRMPGAVVAIARKGKLAYFETFGYLDRASGSPMQRDAIFALASMTKPLVAVGILALSEQNKVRINQAVGEYLPELREMRVAIPDSVDSRPPIRPVTVQDLLRHTAGIPYGSSDGTPLERQYDALDRISMYGTGKEFLSALSRLPLYRDPGTEWNYGYGVDVAGLIIERVTGKSLGDYLSLELFRPIGMVDAGFKLSPEQRRRTAQPLPLDPVSGAKQMIPPESPMHCGGGCGFSTAMDYLRFGQFLLNRGQLNGTRVLGRKTVEYMTSDHLGPEVNIAALRNDRMLNGYGFGLGVAVRRVAGVAGIMGSPGDYLWGGAYGTYFWVDPTEEMVVVFMSAVQGPLRFDYRQIINTLVLQSIVD